MRLCEKCETPPPEHPVVQWRAERTELVPGFFVDLCSPCARAWAWNFLVHESFGELEKLTEAAAILAEERGKGQVTAEKAGDMLVALQKRRAAVYADLYYCASDWLAYGKPGEDPRPPRAV